MTSAVVRMELRDKPPVAVSDPALLFRVIQASFTQRRKKLLNGLTTAFGKEIPRDALAGALAHCGFSENVRGEELGLEEFARLTEELSALL